MEATETLAGIVMLPVAVNAIVVAVAAGLLKVTVQTATPPGASDDGLQVSPLRPEVVIGMAVAVPPNPLIDRGPPLIAALMTPDIPIAAEFTVGANVIDTEATMPLAMRVELIPVARQI